MRASVGELENEGADYLESTDLFQSSDGRSVLLSRDGLRGRTPRDRVHVEAFA